jgi:hypothetical protein
MSRKVAFEGVSPIGATDANALPAKEIGPAVGDDTQCLGFTPAGRGRTTAVLARDGARIGRRSAAGTRSKPLAGRRISWDRGVSSRTSRSSM